MTVERTLTIIKPDAVARGAIGQIIARFEAAGLKVLAAKLVGSAPSRRPASTSCTRSGPSTTSLCAFMT